MTEPQQMPRLYTFVGRVTPERYEWTYSQPIHWRVEYRFPHSPQAGLSLNIQFALNSSQVTAVVTTDGDRDVHQIRAMVLDAVQGYVAALGFVLSAVLNVDLHTSIDPAGNVVVYNTSFPGLEPQLSSQEAVGELLTLVTLGAQARPLVWRAMKEFARAIDFPNDTALHAFRAVEVLRQSYVPADKTDNGATRTASWEALRADLGLSRDELDWLTKHAAPSRHAEPTALLSAADRRRALQIARTAIVEFCRCVV